MSRLVYTSVAALAGGLFGWVGDGGHVLAGVLHYPKKDHLWWPGHQTHSLQSQRHASGLSWWVVPQFALGGVVLSLVVRQVMAYKLRHNAHYALPARFPSYGLGCVCFVASLLTYLLSSLLTVRGWSERYISAALAACMLLIGAILSAAHSSPSSAWRTMLTLAPLIGFGGVAWESALCRIGVFNYIRPDQGLWVNHWIFWLWIAAVWAAMFPMWRFEWNAQRTTVKKSK